MLDTNKKIRKLEEIGFHIGERFPYKLPHAQGTHMVYDLRGDEISDDDYCEVGDDLEGMVNRAYDYVFKD